MRESWTSIHATAEGTLNSVIGCDRTPQCSRLASRLRSHSAKMIQVPGSCESNVKGGIRHHSLHQAADDHHIIRSEQVRKCDPLCRIITQFGKRLETIPKTKLTSSGVSKSGNATLFAGSSSSSEKVGNHPENQALLEITR